MKKFSRLLALLIAAAMLICLVGCRGDSAATDAEQTDPAEPAEEVTPEPEPEPEVPDAAELYAKAAADALELTDYSLDFEMSVKRTIGGEEYDTTEKGTLTVTGAGTDGMLAAAEVARTHENYGSIMEYSFSKGYNAGAAWYFDEYEVGAYAEKQSAEDFLAAFAPAVLFTPENYETVEFADDSMTKISFSGDIEGEEWLRLTEFAAAGTQAGSVELDADGKLVSSDFTAELKIDGIDVELEYKVKLADVPADFAADVPEDASGYLPVNDVRIIELMDLGSIITSSRDKMLTEEVFAECDAGGAVIIAENVVAACGEDEDVAVKEKISTTLMTADGTQTEESEVLYSDGKCAITENGETQTVLADANTILVGVDAAFLASVISYEDFASAELTDADDCWIIDFTGTEDYGDYMQSYTSQTFFADTEYLNSLATDYRTDVIEGYISIDKATGLLITNYYEYCGYHTIEGAEYALSMKSSERYDISSPSVYNYVLDELPETDEPEEKAAPLFYKVTSPEGGELWMLGTIHIGDERTSFLPQEVYDAFDASDALAVECDVDTFAEMLGEDEELMQMYITALTYADGTTYGDHVDDELFEKSELALKKYGYKLISGLMAYKTTMWESSITESYELLGRELSSERGVDTQLLKRARAQEKEVLEVESVEFQMNMIGGFSDTIQAMELESALAEGRFAYNYAVRELLDLWCAGDEDAMREYLSEDEDFAEDEEVTEEQIAAYEEYNNAMLLERNANMLEVVKGYLSGGKTVFVAVGLAHLVGEQGLVDTLREAGYTVELVQYA